MTTTRAVDFTAGGITGWAQAFSTGRVALVLGGGASDFKAELFMTPAEARSIAGALVAMADAAEHGEEGGA